MNKLLLLSFLFCFCFVFQCLSQKGPFEDDEILSRYLKGSYSNTESTGISGSPFLEKTFKNGLLFFEGHDPVQALLRYNVIKEEIQVLLDNDKYAVIQDKVNARIGNVDFTKFNFKDKKGNLLSGYFKVLSPQSEDNKLALLKKPSKKIREGREAGAMRPATASQYIEKSELFLKFPNSNFAVTAEGKTKKFLRLFPEDQQGKLKLYMEKNGLKPNKEANLIEIIKYYNSNF